MKPAPILHYRNHHGRFLKPCPGTPGYICCGYRILNVGSNCPLGCSYCILQAYFQDPDIVVFSNFERKLDEIINVIKENPGEIFRLGTGEFTDSLALDEQTAWSTLLMERFQQIPNVVLEFKTKSVQIRRLLDFPHRDRIIVSWSLNSPRAAAREERLAPSIKERLAAARRCQEAGFALGFHFDPLLFLPGWRQGYCRTLEMMAEMIEPSRIAWISLGAFRYMPELKTIIRRRHPGSRVLEGEFITGLDGKLRYFKPIRIEMYKLIADLIRSWKADAGLYLCMESDEVWQEALGWSPGNTEGLSLFLDNRVRHIFG